MSGPLALVLGTCALEPACVRQLYSAASPDSVFGTWIAGCDCCTCRLTVFGGGGVMCGPAYPSLEKQDF